ncbi:MAG: hypothetical protein RLY70_3502 [Planctomycetota bacterium]
MKLRILDVPDDATQLAAWLDEQLAGYRLLETVSELRALRDLPAADPSPVEIEEWLGQRRDAVLAKGTAALEERQQRELLRRPWLLLDLQEAIDQAGGDYWNQLARRSADTSAALERGRERLLQAMAADARAQAPHEAPNETPNAAARGVEPKRRGSWRAATVGLAAIAAAVTLGFFVFRSLPEPTALLPTPLEPTEVAWGWNAPDLFAGSPTPLEYLRRLADAGNEWSDERPETKPAVAQRIREMRIGCQRLIDHQHAPLAPNQDAALKQLCRKWLGQFNDLQVELEQDERTPREAREAMDQIVAKLTQRLRSGKIES